MSGVGVAKVAQILDLCNFIPQMELKRTSDHDP